MQKKTKATLADVARLAGVSTATVSRALSRPDLLQGETLERVHSAISRLNYVPAGAARALASGRTMTIGAVMPTLDHAIFARALHAMQTELAANGYQLLVAAHDYAPENEDTAVRAMLARGVDALMIVGADHLEETWSQLTQASVPVLLTWSFDPRVPCIGFDNELAGQMTVRHLLDLGHRRFGMISGFLHANDRARARVAGVRKTLQAHGIAFTDEDVVETPFTLAGGRMGLARLMNRKAPPTAIIGGNDVLAVGAVFEAQAAGYHVPDDISIVGIDDLEISAHINPPLTTVHLPTAELGRAAATCLLARLRGEGEGEGRGNRIEMPIELVVRGSSGPVGESRAPG